jgi:hypothetical protein
MKKNVLTLSVLSLFLLLACQNKYYNEIPYKFKFNEDEIKTKLGIINYIPILDTLNQEYEQNLTDRQLYLKEKYSIALGIKPEELTNYKFYDFIDRWIGTPYASKGFSMDSLNIGPFTSALFQYTYKKKLPATPLAIFRSPEINLFTGRVFLKEGDILFFRYHKDVPVGDIGIYLRNNRILVSTKSKGLIISDFNLDYFQLRYVSAGRLIIDQEIE